MEKRWVGKGGLKYQISGGGLLGIQLPGMRRKCNQMGTDYGVVTLIEKEEVGRPGGDSMGDTNPEAKPKDER